MLFHDFIRLYYQVQEQDGGHKGHQATIIKAKVKGKETKLEKILKTGCPGYVAMSGATIPAQYNKKEADRQADYEYTAYTQESVDTFQKQAKRLQKLYGYSTFQIFTGKEFISALESTTARDGSISSIAVFTHGGHNALYFMCDEGFYNGSKDLPQKAGDANMDMLVSSIKQGKIKFALGAVCFIDACGVGTYITPELSKEGYGDVGGLGYDLCLKTGLTVIAAAGRHTEMVNPKIANGQFKVTPQEKDTGYYKFARVTNYKKAKKENPKYSSWNPFNHEPFYIEYTESVFGVDMSFVGSTITIDSFILK